MLIKSIGKIWLKIRPEIFLIRACWFPRVKVRIQILKTTKKCKPASWVEFDLKIYRNHLQRRVNIVKTWMKAIFKFRPVRNLNPWPLRYRCSALPTELTSQLGAGSNIWLPYIQNRLFTTSQVYLGPTHWPAPSWLVSSGGRALHRYQVMGSNSVQAWIFFQAFFLLLLK